MKYELTEEGKQVLDLIENNHNIFLTGNAGTGKSTLLKQFILPKLRGLGKQVAIAAPTGVAAVNVGGLTIHRLFGFPITFLHGEKGSSRRYDLLAELDTIIIDEAPMARADVYDAMDRACKRARGNRKPFGGIQVILIGDLLQLSPIVDKKVEKIFTKYYDTPYFFSSAVYEKAKFKTINLTKIYRQFDEQFKIALNNIRLGIPDLHLINTRAYDSMNMQDVTYLCSLNRDVDKINNENLAKIDTKSRTLGAAISGNFNLRYAPVAHQLKSKEGAKVMICRNAQDGKYVNGTMGYIVNLDSETMIRHYYEEAQAWGEKTVSAIDVRLDKGLIVSIPKATYEEYDYTLVQEFGVWEVKKVVIGTFTQYPLKLAWAISVHKSQGQTLDRVHINWGPVMFDKHLPYVALSRCRSLEGITMSRKLKEKDINADELVIDFLNGNYKKRELQEAMF